MSERNGTAVVTGASAGIGAIYAERLARRGHDLVLVARDAARLRDLAARLEADGVRAEVLPADLTDPAQRDAVIARVEQDDVALLVNNAGMSLDGDVVSAAPEAIERLIALNITAPTLLARAAARAFAGRGGGAIVNIASVLALAPEMFDGAYSGTKSYLLNLSLALAAQHGGHGLYVQAVLPGATRTEIWERSGKDVDSFPAEIVMDVGDLVDAALTGFDRRETVTIPPLHDTADWERMTAARLALAPVLSRREVAPRYRAELTAATR